MGFNPKRFATDFFNLSSILFRGCFQADSSNRRFLRKFRDAMESRGTNNQPSALIMPFFLVSLLLAGIIRIVVVFSFWVYCVLLQSIILMYIHLVPDRTQST